MHELPLLNIMNKTQLIDAIQKELGPDATKKCAADALNATLAAISKAVATEKVQLVGFGTFETKERPARTGRNPHTRQAVSIPATRVPSFKPSKNLKEILEK